MQKYFLLFVLYIFVLNLIIVPFNSSIVTRVTDY